MRRLLALERDRGSDAVGQHGRHGTRLDRVRERAGAIELRLGDELAQLVELAVGLARMADDERRAQHEPVDARLERLHQLARDAARVTAPHPLEHRIADVLERHVDVLDDLGLARDRVDQLVVERARKRVVQPDPVDAVDRAERAQQLRERLAIRSGDARVMPVAREVLRDQVDLAHAGRAERAGLGDDVVELPATLRAAQLRDDAERARPIAALGDLDVRGVRRADPHARRGVIVDVRGRVADLHLHDGQLLLRLRRLWRSGAPSTLAIDGKSLEPRM